MSPKYPRVDFRPRFPSSLFTACTSCDAGIRLCCNGAAIALLIPQSNSLRESAGITMRQTFLQRITLIHDRDKRVRALETRLPRPESHYGFSKTALTVCLLSVSACRSDDSTRPPVRVELTNGRLMFGPVDERTDDTHLRLTLATGRIRLTTPVRWSAVQTVRAGDTTFSRDEFQTQWAAFAVKPAPLLPGPVIREPAPPTPFRGKVASIAGDAWLGHWDSRPDADGLILTLILTNAKGQPVNESGQLDVQLLGLRQGNRGGRLTQGRKPDELMLERWGFPIRAGDFRDGAVQVRLPFRQFRPQTSINVAADAFLRV